MADEVFGLDQIKARLNAELPIGHCLQRARQSDSGPATQTILRRKPKQGWQRATSAKGRQLPAFRAYHCFGDRREIVRVPGPLSVCRARCRQCPIGNSAFSRALI